EPVDGGVVVVAIEPDAAEAIIPEIDAAPVSPSDPRQLAFEDKRYGDVVTGCAKTSVSGEYALICTLSACHVKAEGKARIWAARIATSASRRAAASACRDLGVELVAKAVVRPPPPIPRPIDAGAVDPCVANPMSCQR
ncbi:MAG: hypothetical protein ABI867_45245, partial [Kofleriaceae bacterium]